MWTTLSEFEDLRNLKKGYSSIIDGINSQIWLEFDKKIVPALDLKYVKEKDLEKEI